MEPTPVDMVPPKTRKAQKQINKTKMTGANECISIEPIEKMSLKKRRNIEKSLSKEIKIMRANEVLQTVFKRKPNIEDNNVIVTKPKVVKNKVFEKKRPGRQKKTIDKPLQGELVEADIEPTAAPESNEHIQDVAKKKPRSIMCAKKRTAPLDETLEDSNRLPNISNESSFVKNLSKRRRILPHRLNSINVEEPKKQKRVLRKRVKKETGDSSIAVNGSSAPEVVSHFENEIQTETPHKVVRKNSVTSSSTCFSWTKDISSSSAVTCITVQSNDFVRIDNKVPVIKLTSIDRKVKTKYSNDNIFEENSFDSFCHRRASKSSTVLSPDLNIPQRLNLSTSSLTSDTANLTTDNKIPSQKSKDFIVNKLRQSLDNLSTKMKNFDLEIINWIGYDDEYNVRCTKNFNSRIFEAFKEETSVIKYCNQIKKVLISDVNRELSPQVIEQEAESYNKVTPPEPPDAMTNNNILEHVEDSANLNESFDKVSNNSDHNGGGINDTKSFGKEVDTCNNDDDDAISLDAESITSLESSKSQSMSGLNADKNDANVSHPEIKRSLLLNNQVCPSTSIVKNIQEKHAYPRIVCSIDDSSPIQNKPNESSMHKRIQYVNERMPVNGGDEIENFKISNNIDRTTENVTAGESTTFSIQNINDTENSITSENLTERFRDFDRNETDVPPNLSPKLINRVNGNHEMNGRLPANGFDSSYNINDVKSNSERALKDTEKSNCRSSTPEVVKPLSPVGANHMSYSGSRIFNVCIFNLINNCKKTVCQFPHVHIEVGVVKTKLRDLSKEQFHKECMYMTKWPSLRLLYGMCFVEECVRRDMTRLLLITTKNFIDLARQSMKPKNATKRYESNITEVVEAALLHLNNQDLVTSADLLHSKIGPTMLLCDFFMRTISETQNFSRFKSVFIKLTLFMCRIGRIFKLNVANQLLERLCILPYDESLAIALMKIIPKTDPKIFGVPMMGLLENQLSTNNTQLHEQLILLKHAVTGNGLLPTPARSPVISPSGGIQTSTPCKPNSPHPPHTPVTDAESPSSAVMDTMQNATEPLITRTIMNSRLPNGDGVNMSTGSDSSEDKTFPPRRFKPRWGKFPPGGALQRLQMQVHQQRARFVPRTYSGNTPRFRRIAYPNHF